MELFDATAQWSTRPDDQRFWTVEELSDACRKYADAAIETEIDTVGIRNRLETKKGEIGIALDSGFSRLTNWSFDQLATSAKAPPKYLSRLSPELAVRCLEEGLAEQGRRDRVVLSHPTASGSIVRGITSGRYNRLWNADTADRLLDLGDEWKVPPARPYGGATRTRPATEEDVIAGMTGGVQIRVGETIAPAGLYASDRDFWAFLVRPDRPLDDGSEGGLFRGLIVQGCEVGGISQKIETFLCRGVCGNHIIWGASEVVSHRVLHVGETYADWEEAVSEVEKAIDVGAGAEERKIKQLQGIVLGKTVDEVADLLSGRNLLPARTVRSAFDAAVPEQDGDPVTAWGFANAVTRLSQASTFTDGRTALDRKVGPILDFALAN